MKPKSSRTSGDRFHAPIRHYHRINTKKEMSWDAWIHGSDRKGKISAKQVNKWLRFAAVTLALFTVAALVVGLFIELS